MHNLKRAVISAVLFSMVGIPDASAQGSETAKRKFGSTDTDWSKVAGAAPAGPTITRSDLEKMSPLKLFVDKKKDLKLNETQLAAVTESDAKLRQSNTERYLVVDSLKKLMKPHTTGTPSVEEQTRMVLAGEAMMETLKEIRMSYDVAAKGTLSGFEPDQQKTAAALLEKQQQDVATMLRDKMGGGGGRMGGGARPGRPPV